MTDKIKSLVERYGSSMDAAGYADGTDFEDRHRSEADKTLAEIIAALESQAARLSELETKCRLYEASLDKADGERDALAKDAERYRWLRDFSEPGICAFYLSVGQAFAGVKFKRETVDEAIDSQIAALSQSTGEPK